MINLFAAWAQNHSQFIVGLVSGWALTHVAQVTGLAFHQLMKVPFIRQAIVSNPDRAKAIIDEVSKELDKDIDQEAGKPPVPPTA